MMEPVLGLIVLIVVALVTLGVWKLIKAADADLRAWEASHPRQRGNWTGDE